MAGITANSASVTMAGGDTAADKAVGGFVTGEAVALATSPTGSTYQWAISRPEGSSAARATLSSASSATPSFTPDVGGYYTVSCTVDGTTVYVLRASVTQVAVTTALEALRLQPKSAASVVAPPVGRALFVDPADLELTAKAPDATVTKHQPETVAAVASTGVTPAAAATIAVADLAAVDLEVRATMRATDGTHHAALWKSATFYREGGAVAQLGTTEDVVTPRRSDAGIEITLTPGATSVAVAVVGVADKTGTWRVRVAVRPHA